MTTIYDMLQRAKEAKKGLDGEMARIVQRLSEEIIDLNRKGQLFKGLNTEGEIIGRYSKATEWITTNDALLGKGNRIKKAGDPYDFYDTGDLFKAFTLDYNDGRIEIFSTDSKVPMLEEKYGNNLFGLTVEHQEELNQEMLRPFVVEFVRRILFSR